MRAAIWGALLVCSLTSMLAEEPCPWLNSATAGGIVGGSVTSRVTLSGRGKTDGVCEFVRQSEPNSVLRIEVTTMENIQEEFKSYLARCTSAGSPVRGIGNLAIACRSKQSDKNCEQIVGRVRGRAFVVQLCAKDVATAVGNKVRDAADEVAGNLF